MGKLFHTPNRPSGNPRSGKNDILVSMFRDRFMPSRMPTVVAAKRLFSWGTNAQGEIGDNAVVARSSPVQVGTTATWIASATGATHSLAIQKDSTLWAWGASGFDLSFDGRLGDNTITDKSSPVQVGTLKTWASVSAGARHSVARQSNSSIWAWGLAGSGQLGANGPDELAKKLKPLVGLAGI